VRSGSRSVSGSGVVSGSGAEADSAEPFVPDTRDLARLDEAAASCRGCDLYRDATQTVFGRGAGSARVLLLGEQPGDVEDRVGEAFVGPAGKLLDRALAQAGFAEEDLYRTNAVKHFRWHAAPGGGKRRIHQSPTYRQIVACRPWLVAELDAVRPEVVVVLGASAGKSLFGSGFRVGEHRGTLVPWPERDDLPVLVTVHPSSVLRADDREGAFEAFVTDLRTVTGAPGSAKV
jgi:uracil-DNA glycosylase